MSSSPPRARTRHPPVVTPTRHPPASSPTPRLPTRSKRTLRFRLSHRIILAPSSLGELQELTQVGFGVGHQINERSSMFLSGAFLYQVPITSIQVDSNQIQRQALVLSVGYQRNLSQYWDLNLAYNFIEQDNGDAGFLQPFNDKGSSNSNAVFLTIRRTFNLFGTPTSPDAFGSPASPGSFGSPASPGLFGSPASPGLSGSPASSGLFGSPASPERARRKFVMDLRISNRCTRKTLIHQRPSV